MSRLKSIYYDKDLKNAFHGCTVNFDKISHFYSLATKLNS